MFVSSMWVLAIILIRKTLALLKPVERVCFVSLEVAVFRLVSIELLTK